MFHVMFCSVTSGTYPDRIRFGGAPTVVILTCSGHCGRVFRSERVLSCDIGLILSRVSCKLLRACKRSGWRGT